MRNNIALRIARLQRRFQRRDCVRLLAAMMAAAIALPAMGNAQPSAAIRRVVPQSNAPAPHKGKNAARQMAASAKPAQTAQAPEPPPAPPMPQWPVNDPPQQATVTWNAQGLSITARNSSLQQILDQIAAQTGVKVEGMGKDVRVFGVYGPGQPNEILSELLEGTNYNVLMIGHGTRGVPQQIVLSAKPAGGPEPNAPVPQGDIYEPPIAPYQPPPMPQRPPQPNEPPRTPQQILQEMQQRQLLMREQQMQQEQQEQRQQQQQQQ